MRARERAARWLLCVAAMLAALPSWAIPPFARKYGTACQTCHTVYPKLNAFGEAFRRNGLRFPGVDGDAVKQEPIHLGQEAQAKAFPDATWPGTLPASAPLGVSLDGRALAFPDSRSSAARAQGSVPVDLRGLAGELHLWAGGSLDDRATFFAQLTATSEGAVELENAELHFNDLLGPAVPFDVVAGKAIATVTSFGPHSSYLADTQLVSAPLTSLGGGTSGAFRLLDPRPGLEANGVFAHRATWSFGVASGPSVDVHPAETAWVHAGVLLGGAEGEASPAALLVALDGFAMHARSRFTGAAGDTVEDVATVAGGALRVTVKRLELDASLSVEAHDRALGDGGGATLLVHADELSWTVFPWLVPAVRVEYLRVTPMAGPSAWNLRLVPGVAVLVRQNVKLGLVARLEAAHGAPAGGWAKGGGAAAPGVDGGRVGLEWESVLASAGAAF